ETVGKFYGDLYTGFQSGAMKAQSSNAQLNRTKQLLANVKTGALQPGVQTAKSVARDLGIDLERLGITDDVPFGDALRSIGTQFALDAVSDTKGAVSDKEMALFA